MALGVGLLARLAAFLPFAQAPIAFDESYYVNVASTIAAGAGHSVGIYGQEAPGALRPPLFPALLAGAFELVGKRISAIRAFQIPLSLLVIACVFAVASRRFGPRAGFVSALFCALWPALAHYPHFLWAENLAAVWVALFFFWMDRFDRHERLRDACAAGLTLGLAALTKEVWLYFGLPAAAWILYRARGEWRRAVPAVALFAAALVLPVAPWTLRNALVMGEPIPISANRWFPLAMGNLFPPDDFLAETPRELRRAVIRRARPLARPERERFYRELALQLVSEHQPGWLGKKLLRTPVTMYNLESQPLRFLAEGWLEPSRGTALALVATEVVGHYAALVPGVLALWLVPGGATKVLVVGALLYLHGIHVVANAVPRFTVPLLPLYCLYAGPLLLGRFPRPRVWRWAGAGATLAALVLLPLPRSIAFLRGLLAQL